MAPRETPTPGPWRVYRCDLYASDRADERWCCGIESESDARLVASSDAYDECSHRVMRTVDAELIVRLCNEGLVK